MQVRPIQMTDKLITTQRAAELTGYTEHNIRKLARQGKIKTRRFGRMWMINQESVLNYRRIMDNLGPAKYTPIRYRETEDEDPATADQETLPC